MSTVLFVGILLLAFATMEFVAWFSHKYIMHGFLWVLHKDHHDKKYKEQERLEKNDYFFVIFAMPAIVGFIYASYYPGIYITAIAMGISLYGMVYVFIHDILIHKRIAIPFQFNNRYFTGLIKAHKQHHANIEKHNSKNFGFVFLIPMHYFRKNA